MEDVEEAGWGVEGAEPSCSSFTFFAAGAW